MGTRSSSCSLTARARSVSTRSSSRSLTTRATSVSTRSSSRSLTTSHTNLKNDGSSIVSDRERKFESTGELQENCSGEKLLPRLLQEKKSAISVSTRSSSRSLTANHTNLNNDRSSIVSVKIRVCGTIILDSEKVLTYEKERQSVNDSRNMRSIMKENTLKLHGCLPMLVDDTDADMENRRNVNRSKTYFKTPDDTLSNNNSSKRTQTNAHLSNTLWRAFCSAEPQNGVTYLSHLLTAHSMVPKSRLMRSFYELIIHGNIYEGVSFVDGNRTELGTRYSTGVLQKFSFGIRLSWDDVEKCLSLPIYGKCLCSAAFAIEYISEIMKKQIMNIRKLNTDQDSLVSFDLVQTLMQCPGDIRGALKCVSKWSAKNWARHGPIALNPSKCQSIYATNAMRCLVGLGKISCYVAWVFCELVGVDINEDKECCYIVRDNLLVELQTIQKEQSFTREQLLRDLKLSFVLTLDEEFCLEWQNTMAALLTWD